MFSKVLSMWLILTYIRMKKIISSLSYLFGSYFGGTNYSLSTNKIHCLSLRINHCLVLFFLLFLFSCKPITNENNLKLSNLKNTFLIINEGNFNWNNGSLGIYYSDSNKVENKVYEQINNEKLGDIPQSACITNDFIYLIVNNSGKIVKTHRNSLQKVAELDGLISPRYIIKVAKYAYVSDLYAGKISVLNFTDFSLEKEIPAPKSTENMLLVGTKLYILNWSFGDKLLILDTQKNQLTDSLNLTLEPNSLVLDKNNNLWVLCGGGFNSSEYPALYQIDTEIDTIISSILFPNKADSPIHLVINQDKDSLYFLNGAIYKMGIESIGIPEQSFISAGKRNLYALFVDSQDRVWTSDAKNFVKDSEVYIYTSQGKLITSFAAGVNASQFYELGE